MKRWRGLKSLVVDAVEHGSRAVEKVQIETMKLPFALLSQVDPIKAPVQGIQEIHDTAVTSVHGMIRLVNRVAGVTLDAVLDAVETRQGVPNRDREGADSSHDAPSVETPPDENKS